MKKFWLVISTVVVSIVLLVIVNQKFMFNPLMFRPNAVTYNDWSDYTYPSTIEFLYWDNKDGWTIGKESSNKKEIKYIFKELRDSLELGMLSRNVYKDSEIERELKLIIRRSDGVILLQFDYYEGGNIANLSNGNYIRIPSELKSALLEKTFN